MIKEMLRFCVVGGICFLIDFVLLLFLQEVALKGFDHGVLISAAVAFSISLVIHYFLATFWVFKDNSVNSRKAHARAGSLFVITNMVGLGVNELCMWVGVILLGFHYIIIKLFATAVVMIWNYCCQKFFIYREEVAR